MRPSASRQSDMVSAAKTYREAFQGSPAQEYMARRGLAETAERLALGYVSTPHTGHERARAWLAVPYLRPAGANFTATVRFRCINPSCLAGEKEQHDGHGKYLSLPGDKPRLFNTEAVARPRRPYVAICEGELDAMTAEECGIPAVGVAGVSGWRDHFVPAFLGFETVFLIADRDDTGQGEEFADKVAVQLPNSKVVLSPNGHDLNSFYRAEGPEAVRKLVGIHE